MGKNKVLGVIPARGGSKDIPKKNLYSLNGRPLISYTIKEAAESKLLTKFIVSTDSEEIAKISRRYGAEVPFMRPKVLATDKALAIDVMKHATLEMERLDCTRYDYLVMLQPTTPLRIAKDIDDVIDKLIKTGCDSVVTMVDVGANHPSRMYRVLNDHLVRVLENDSELKPRQELEPVYIRSGDVYACKRKILFEKNSLIGDDSMAIIIPPHRAVNIDSPSDLVLAELYLKQKSKKGKR